jgi:murein DD-endopeptidase MepM/ murein hydrolase activator NlpD
VSQCLKKIGVQTLTLAIAVLSVGQAFARPVPELSYQSRDTLDTIESNVEVDFISNPYAAILGLKAHETKSTPGIGASPFSLPRSVNTGMGIRPPKNGFSHPVQHMRLMRGFDDNDCWHQGIDIGGQGELGGVGEPIRSIVRAKVTFIGTPEMNPKKFGRRDRRSGFAKRRHYRIPRRMQVDGYPNPVYPMTLNLGRSRTGVFIVTEAMHPKVHGYSVRYMHLAAVKPGLEVGDIVESGEEIGLMGATAIMVSAPHVHIDVETPKGMRVNPAHFLGLDRVYTANCRPINKRYMANWRKRRKNRSRRRSGPHRH